jgi:hypothetical protein
MKHYLCRKTYDRDQDGNVIDDGMTECEHCQREFDRKSSYCGKCWSIVTNKSYLAKNSKHVLGTCNQRHSIPKAIFQRTAGRRGAYPYPAGWNNPLRPECFKPYVFVRMDGRPFGEEETEVDPAPAAVDETLLMRRIELLEQQNELLRQVAAMGGRL